MVKKTNNSIGSDDKDPNMTSDTTVPSRRVRRLRTTGVSPSRFHPHLSFRDKVTAWIWILSRLGYPCFFISFHFFISLLLLTKTGSIPVSVFFIRVDYDF